MRIAFHSLTHPKRLAKALCNEVSSLKLSDAQECIAQMLGYRDFHELQQLHGTIIPSAPDSASPSDVVALRHAFQVTKLMSCLGCDRATAVRLATSLDATGRRTSLHITASNSRPPTIDFGQILASRPINDSDLRRDPGAYIAYCLRRLDSQVYDESDLYSFCDEELDLDLYWMHPSLPEAAITWVERLPLVPAAWFVTLTDVWRMANDCRPPPSIPYIEIHRAAMKQLRKAIWFAGRLRMKDCYYAILRDAGKIIADAAAEGYFSEAEELARSLLLSKAAWRTMSPAYYDVPFDFNHEQELKMWIAASRAARGDFTAARKLLNALQVSAPLSTDIRVLQLGVEAAVDSLAIRRYIRAATTEVTEGIGFIRDFIREDPDGIEVSSLIAYIAASLHVPAAGPHAIVMELNARSKAALYDKWRAIG